jgi:uncharacterized tellurite resistance protein B-like protein
MMIGMIQAYLAKRLPPNPAWPFELEELAAAALMVECARIDGEFAAEEREAICRAVMEELVLDEETAECLGRVAEIREDEVWHDWLFTETVKKSFDEYDRLAVIRRLWDVTLADGIVHPFEEFLITRIARELDVSEEAVGRQLTVALRRHPGLTSLMSGEATRPCS